jgi:hypothetical protein
MTTHHKEVFAQQIQVIAATSAFKHAISDQWNHPHDLSPSTPKTEKLITTIRRAQSAGVAIWPILKQEEKFPSAALLIAHNNYEMNPSGSTEIEPLPTRRDQL